MNDDLWIIRIGKLEHGPISKSDVLRLVAQKKADFDTPLRPHDCNEWSTVGDVISPTETNSGPDFDVDLLPADRAESRPTAHKATVAKTTTSAVSTATVSGRPGPSRPARDTTPVAGRRYPNLTAKILAIKFTAYVELGLTLVASLAGLIHGFSESIPEAGLGAITLLILGLGVYVVTMASAELLQVIMDIEENTRRPRD